MTDKATPRPWRWEIHDGSLASIEGPDGAVYHVLSVSPCKECRKDEWEWGNCFTPSLADADLIVAAVNSYSPDKDEKVRALVEAAEGAANMCEVASRTMFDHGFNEAGHHFLAWTSTLRAALAALGETA